MAITKTQIIKWNKQFDNLSKPEQRVLIAKDVLQQLKKDKYRANTGSYVLKESYLENTCDIQSNFDKLGKCNVCALGGIVLNLTKYKNTLNIGDLDGFSEKNSKFSKLLEKYFTPKQQALIEHAFEGDTHNHSKLAYEVYLSFREIDACINFYENYEDETDRLKAIMNNLIFNKGIFKP